TVWRRAAISDLSGTFSTTLRRSQRNGETACAGRGEHACARGHSRRICAFAGAANESCSGVIDQTGGGLPYLEPAGKRQLRRRLARRSARWDCRRHQDPPPAARCRRSTARTASARIDEESKAPVPLANAFFLGARQPPAYCDGSGRWKLAQASKRMQAIGSNGAPRG